MPYAAAPDGVRLYYEECGAGTPVLFVHEYAGDHRSWEPQLRYLCRQYRCITFSARGYPPSDVPTDGARYSQDIARDDVRTVMDHLKLERAHIVGHSMGAYTTLHMGVRYPERCLSLTAAGCGWGSNPPSASRAPRSRRTSRACSGGKASRRPRPNTPISRCASGTKARIRAAGSNSVAG